MCGSARGCFVGRGRDAKDDRGWEFGSEDERASRWLCCFILMGIVAAIRLMLRLNAIKFG